MDVIYVFGFSAVLYLLYRALRVDHYDISGNDLIRVLKAKDAKSKRERNISEDALPPVQKPRAQLRVLNGNSVRYVRRSMDRF